MPSPGGSGAAETCEPRQIREEAAVNNDLWVPSVILPGYLFLIGVILLFLPDLWQNKTMSRWIKFFIAIFIGVIMGLVYGWVISPVQYRDTTPTTLRYDYRTDYVLMVAEIFNSTQDIDLAIRQLGQLGSNSSVELTIESLVYATQMGYSQEDMVLIQNLATALQTHQSTFEGFIP